MSNCADNRQVEALLYHEALYLDEKRWYDWLELFEENAVLWVPTWKDDGEPTSSPTGELSLMYCSSKAQLKERVDRASGGRSIASLPPLRTAHIVSNIICKAGDGEGLTIATCVTTTHHFNEKTRTQDVVFSRQRYELRANGAGGLRIAEKRVLLLNDYISRMMDFYML